MLRQPQLTTSTAATFGVILCAAAITNIHALWDSNVLSDHTEGNLRTVVYDLSRVSPWRPRDIAQAFVPLALCVLVAVLRWRDMPIRITALAGATWFLKQFLDEIFTGNLYSQGGLEWVFGLGLALLVLIYLLYDPAADHTRRPGRRAH